MARYLIKGTSMLVLFQCIYYGLSYGFDIRRGLGEGYRGA